MCECGYATDGKCNAGDADDDDADIGGADGEGNGIAVPAAIRMAAAPGTR